MKTQLNREHRQKWKMLKKNGKCYRQNEKFHYTPTRSSRRIDGEEASIQNRKLESVP